MNSGVSFKQFTGITILIICLLGISIITFAIQKPTNTKSDASDCTKKPTWVLTESKNDKYYITYNLSLINNCSSKNDFLIRVSEFPNQPTYYGKWYWKFGNGDYNKPLIKQKLSGINKEKLTIFTSEGLNTTQPTKLKKGTYKYFTVKATLLSNPKIFETISLTYKVN